MTGWGFSLQAQGLMWRQHREMGSRVTWERRLAPHLVRSVSLSRWPARAHFLHCYSKESRTQLTQLPGRSKLVNAHKALRTELETECTPGSRSAAGPCLPCQVVSQPWCELLSVTREQPAFFFFPTCKVRTLEVKSFSWWDNRLLIWSKFMSIMLNLQKESCRLQIFTNYILPPLTH